MAPDAIREFFAIGLRQKPPHLRSVEGFEPTDDAGPRKYVVVVLDGEALATFKREAVPAVVWGGHVGWPAAPVLGTAAGLGDMMLRRQTEKGLFSYHEWFPQGDPTRITYSITAQCVIWMSKVKEALLLKLAAVEASSTARL